MLAHTRPHVVFAHGSANLVLSACAHSKQKGCKRLGDKTVWYGIQAPLKGTDAPKVMQKLCPKLVENPIFKGGVDCVEQPSKSANKNKDKADKQGKAPAAAAAPAPAPAPGATAAATAPHPPPQGAATPAPAAGAAAPAPAPAPAAAEKKKYKLSAAWKALVPAEVPRWVHKVAVEKMGGSMCGVTPTDYSKPKAEVEQSAFATIAAAVAERRGKSKRRDEAADWKARNALSRQKVPRNGNDGIVSFTSCRVRSHSEYEKQPTAKHYVIDGDYDFGTCADGTRHPPTCLLSRLSSHLLWRRVFCVVVVVVQARTKAVATVSRVRGSRIWSRLRAKRRVTANRASRRSSKRKRKRKKSRTRRRRRRPKRRRRRKRSLMSRPPATTLLVVCLALCHPNIVQYWATSEIFLKSKFSKIWVTAP